MICNQNHGQWWACNIKLPFKEINQPFGDNLITLYPSTMSAPDHTRSLSHFKEGIISFSFSRESTSWLGHEIYVVVMAVCIFLEGGDLCIIFKKRGTRELNTVEWDNSTHPKGSEESEDSRFSETLSQRYSSHVTRPPIFSISVLAGVPDFPRLRIHPPPEFCYNYVLDLMLCFSAKHLQKMKECYWWPKWLSVLSL